MNTIPGSNLNAGGRMWLGSCLEAGGALAHSVIANSQMDNARVYILITNEAHSTAAKMNHPLELGVQDISVINLDQPGAKLLQELQKFEKQSGPLTLVVEDNLTQPGDPILATHHTGELYRFDGRILNVKQLDSVQGVRDLLLHLGQSSGYPLNMFIIPTKAIPIHKNLDQKSINYLASKVVGIINTAYDGETFTLAIA